MVCRVNPMDHSAMTPSPPPVCARWAVRSLFLPQDKSADRRGGPTRRQCVRAWAVAVAYDALKRLPAPRSRNRGAHVAGAVRCLRWKGRGGRGRGGERGMVREWARARGRDRSKQADLMMCVLRIAVRLLGDLVILRPPDPMARGSIRSRRPCLRAVAS